MSGKASSPKVGIGLKETIKHGTISYPIGIYNEQIYPDSNTVQYLHWHDEYELFIILNGGCEMNLNNNKFTAFKGDMILIDSGIIHGAMKIPNMDCEFLALVFSRKLVESLSPDRPNTILNDLFAKIGKRPRIMEGSSYSELQIEALKLAGEIRELNDERGLGYELLTKAKLLEILGLFYRYGSKTKIEHYTDLVSETSYKRALSYINEKSAEPITVKDIADHASLSISQLDRVFKANMDTTPIAYLTHLRISKSLNMLINSDESISSIAYSVGFNDFSYYGKTFRKIIGMTPRDFRNTRAKHAE